MCITRSIVGKLNLLKETWKSGITKKDMNMEINNIVKGIKTLTTHFTAEDLGRMVKKLGTIPQVVDKVVVFINSVGHIIFQMSVLTNCSSPWSEVFVRSIINRLNKFKTLWIYTSQEDTIKEVTKVAKIIKTLRDNVRLFYALEANKLLSTGIGFKGTDHCESGLAAFLYACAEWNEIVSHLFSCLLRSS